MHIESLEHMELHIKEYLPSPCRVLDVGSLNVKNKGCYRQLLSSSYDYTGVDISPGDNVDIVLEDPYVYPFEDQTFDAVLCGQVVEHCEQPFKLMAECARVLKPGGFFLGVAPSVWYVHRYPVDCWRILPDGWKALFNSAGLTTVKTYLSTIDVETEDCWGIATK